MKLPTLVLFSILVAVGVHSTVSAEVNSAMPAESRSPEAEPATHSTLGPYIAIGGGLAAGDLGADAAGANPRLVQVRKMNTESGSVNVRAGYRFHPRVSAELLWEYQTGWDFTATDDHATLTAWNLVANLKGHLTDTQWQPFVVAGLGLGHRQTDSRHRSFDPNDGTALKLDNADEAFVARLGVGLDVHLGESFSLGGEAVYVLGSGNLDSLDYAITTLVLAYKFH